MEARQNDHRLVFENVEKGVRESAEDGFPNAVVNLREGEWKPEDPGSSDIDGPDEFGAESLSLLIVPGPRVEDVEAGFGSKREPQRRSASEEFSAEDFPRDGHGRVRLVRLEPAAQLFPLGLGEFKDLGRSRDAVPQVLSQLYPLGDREPAEVEVRRHTQTSEAWGKPARDC
jgi:hypothetical protein